MNEFARCRRDVFLGIKGFQNIRASLAALDRLYSLVDSDDHLMLSSLFYMAVIRYIKPFLNTETGSGLASYPLKHLKANPNFSMKMHEHLKEVRNTLIAHDDFEQIEPRLLFMGLTLQGTDLLVPTSVIISNKCVSHPSDLEGVQIMKKHVASVLDGFASKLGNDIRVLRSLKIEKPEQAKEMEKYSNSYGQQNIPQEGAQLLEPDLASEQWLDPKEPDFSEIHNGFRYEMTTIKQEFHGPERIKLPNGYEIEINPS